MFDPEIVLNQLRYSGMLETVKIRRAGFPVRRTFKDFFSRQVSLHLQYLFCVILVHTHASINSIAQTSVIDPSSFFVRYKIILKDKVPAAGDDKKRSTDLLFKYDKTKKEWQLGKTKVRPRNAHLHFKNIFQSFLDVSTFAFVGVHEGVFGTSFGEG